MHFIENILIGIFKILKFKVVHEIRIELFDFQGSGWPISLDKSQQDEFTQFIYKNINKNLDFIVDIKWVISFIFYILIFHGWGYIFYFMKQKRNYHETCNSLPHSTFCFFLFISLLKKSYFHKVSFEIIYSKRNLRKAY